MAPILLRRGSSVCSEVNIQIRPLRFPNYATLGSLKESGGSADLRNGFPGNFGLSVSLGPFVVLATRRFKTGHCKKTRKPVAMPGIMDLCLLCL
jgi:hypothetical protein